MSEVKDEGKVGLPSAAKPEDVASPKKKTPAPRKKSKKPKDMPKRPLSAYNIFFQIERKKLIEAREKGDIPDDFDMASVSSNSDGDEQDKKKRASLFQAIAQTIANRWKSLPSDERVKFEELAKEEMKKYRIKKDEYQQRMVRETLDGSSGRSSAAARSPAMASAQPGAASSRIPAGAAMVGLPQGASTLARHGLFGGQGGAVAVGPDGMPLSFAVQDYLQRQGLYGGEHFIGAGGLGPQEFRFQSMGLQGSGMDRLLALRALQNDPIGLRFDPSYLQGGAGGYLGLSGGLDPRLAESLRFQEGASRIGGSGPGGLSNYDLLGRGSLPSVQLSDLPPEQLLRYLNARQGGQYQPPPPPGGSPGYGPGAQGF
eukprot:scaffold1328_cov162-Amphora_coffeaeformis.AAC.30